MDAEPLIYIRLINRYITHHQSPDVSVYLNAMLRYSLVCFAFLASSLAREPFIEQLHWKYFNYTWPSSEAYLAAKNDGSYVEKNNIQGGIKVWKNKLYLAIPRFKKGIPVTLAVTSATAVNKTYGPNLEPYPNWEAQKIGDCSVLQNVHNMEIDPKGRMWVVDTGRVNTMSAEPNKKCPPKLVILDLENGGKVLKSYVFPEDVVDRNSGELLDIAIDHEHGGVAYVVDSDEKNPGIVVYSLANNTSWKVHHSSMLGVDEATDFRVEDSFMRFKINLHGITLSPASTEGSKREVYFAPLSSFIMYTIPTRILIEAQHKMAGEEREKFVGQNVKNVGRKPSQSEGMTMTNNGKLYYGMLADAAVTMWDSMDKYPFQNGQRIIARDSVLMQSPGNFAVDDEGYLWLFTNRMHRFVNDKMDINEINYRAMKMKLDEKGYQYYADGRAPELPKIGERESSFVRLG